MRGFTRKSLSAGMAIFLGFATALTLSGGATASAADADNQGGLWYYNAYGIADANAAGANGSGVKIAVIDSLIDSQWPALKGADITIREPSYCASAADPATSLPATSTQYNSAFHGTSMVSLLVGNGTGPSGEKGPLGVSPKAQILYYAVSYEAATNAVSDLCPAPGVAGDTGDVGLPKAFAAALNQAVADGAEIVTYAAGIGTITPEVLSAVAAAERAGVVIVAARPNEAVAVAGTSDVSALNGLVTVQAMNADGVLQTSSTIADPATDVVGPGVGILGPEPDFATAGLTNGTSPATNIVAGFLADLKSKYPKATGNQLIQALLRNTGDGQHGLTKDPKNFAGYGVASLRQMLKVDPTTYPDVNPLLSADAAATPTYQQVTGQAAPPASEVSSVPSAKPSARPSTASSARAAGGSGVLTTALIAGGIVVLLIIVAAIVVLVIILGRRSRGKRPPGGSLP